MTRFLLILGSTLLIGCDGTSTTEALAPAGAESSIAHGVVASVTGSGNVVGAPEDWFGLRVFTVSANKQSDDSVLGHYNLKYAPIEGEQLAGTVTCLTVEGNTAYLGGTVEKHPFPLPPGLELTGVAIEIEDNGSNAATPDRVSFLFYYLNAPDGPQSYCDNPTATPDPFMLEIDAGNMTVR